MMAGAWRKPPSLKTSSAGRRVSNSAPARPPPVNKAARRRRTELRLSARQGRQGLRGNSEHRPLRRPLSARLLPPRRPPSRFRPPRLPRPRARCPQSPSRMRGPAQRQPPHRRPRHRPTRSCSDPARRRQPQPSRPGVRPRRPRRFPRGRAARSATGHHATGPAPCSTGSANARRGSRCGAAPPGRSEDHAPASRCAARTEAGGAGR